MYGYNDFYFILNGFFVFSNFPEYKEKLLLKL